MLFDCIVILNHNRFNNEILVLLNHNLDLRIYLTGYEMKKSILIVIALLLYSCGKDTIQNDCFRGISINEVVNLRTPQYIDLRVPGGHTITNLGGRRVIIINRNNFIFKAFDLECPEKDCSSPMTFDGLKMICSCSDKEYSSLDGSPIDAQGCSALEYNVEQTSSTTLVIRSFE